MTRSDGWFADPTGRYRLRYWDGTIWTEHVTDNGETDRDPITIAPTPTIPQKATHPDADAISGRSGPRWARPIATIGALALLLVAASVGVGLFASSASAEEAVVERVIDGDTIDVKIEGQTERVRLLNIDTPETKDPNEPVECLGPEATAFTGSLLQPGQTVELEYDEDRTDKYGRTLAHVKLGDGRYVSDEIARAGLGDAIVVGVNDKRFADVRDALTEASDHERGFFDPAQKCTIAHQLTVSEQLANSAQKIETGTSPADAAAAAASAYVVAKSMSEVKAAIGDGTTLPARAFFTVGREAEIAAVSRRYTAVIDQRKEFVKLKKVRAQKIKVKKRALAERKAAAEREAAAREAARIAAEEAARRNSAPKSDDSSGDSGGPDAGYTGPRCYAPGGKTWKPCP